MTDHVLCVNAWGWVIEHPEPCPRKTCAVDKAAVKQAGPPTKRLGRFEVSVDERGKLDVGLPCR